MSSPPLNNLDHVTPTVSDIKKNTACFVSSRTRGPVDDDIVRSSCLNENVQFVPIPKRVPSQVHDPSPPSPEEDVHISQLQKVCDETQVARPGELGKNLSLPR